MDRGNLHDGESSQEGATHLESYSPASFIVHTLASSPPTAVTQATATLKSIRKVLVIAAGLDYRKHIMKFRTAFLEASMEEGKGAIAINGTILRT